jgi:hypothetical protein
MDSGLHAQKYCSAGTTLYCMAVQPPWQNGNQHQSLNGSGTALGTYDALSCLKDVFEMIRVLFSQNFVPQQCSKWATLDAWVSLPLALLSQLLKGKVQCQWRPALLSLLNSLGMGVVLLSTIIQAASTTTGRLRSILGMQLPGAACSCFRLDR